MALKNRHQNVVLASRALSQRKSPKNSPRRRSAGGYRDAAAAYFAFLPPWSGALSAGWAGAPRTDWIWRSWRETPPSVVPSKKKVLPLPFSTSFSRVSSHIVYGMRFGSRPAALSFSAAFSMPLAISSRKPESACACCSVAYLLASDSILILAARALASAVWLVSRVWASFWAAAMRLTDAATLSQESWTSLLNSVLLIWMSTMR